MKASIYACFLGMLFIPLASVMTPATAQAASDGTAVTVSQTGRGTVKVRRRQFNPFSTRRASRYSSGRFGLPARTFRSAASSSVNGQSLASGSALSSPQSPTASAPVLIAPLPGGLSIPTVSSARTPYTPSVRSPYRPPPRPSF